MTRHLVKLMWNRKRHNFLLAVEIFFSFFVLFAVVLMATTYLHNWRQPLGYSIDGIWRIGLNANERADDGEARTRRRLAVLELLAALSTFRGVEGAAGVTIAPYDSSSSGWSIRLTDGRNVRFGFSRATDAFADLVKLTINAGRWFSKEDDGAAWTPVVINQRMAWDVFGGDAAAVGQVIPEKQEPDSRGEVPQPKRVIGVIQDFRKEGELSTPEHFLFYRIRLDDQDLGTAGVNPFPDALLIRVSPGTTAAYEEPLVKLLHSVAPGWSFEVRTLELEREDRMRTYTIPLIALGTIAAFLLMMVALGLTGVVWQSVTQRMREFGLRRAKGATARNVRRQVLAELSILTTMALMAGVFIVSQLAMLPLIDPDFSNLVSGGVFVTSIAVSAGAIYLLTLACGWYPSRLATKIQPAEALHYE